jgi:hypothetical protein
MDAVAPSTAPKLATASGHSAVVSWLRALRVSPPYRDGRIGISVVHAGRDEGLDDDVVAFEGTIPVAEITAAEIIALGLQRRDAVIVLPTNMYLFRVLTERIVPDFLMEKLGLASMLIGGGGGAGADDGKAAAKARAPSLLTDGGDARGLSEHGRGRSEARRRKKSHNNKDRR